MTVNHRSATTTTRAASGNDRTTKTFPVQLAQQYGSKNGSRTSIRATEKTAVPAYAVTTTARAASVGNRPVG